MIYFAEQMRVELVDDLDRFLGQQLAVRTDDVTLLEASVPARTNEREQRRTNEQFRFYSSASFEGSINLIAQ